MSTNKIFSSLHKIAAAYKAELNRINDTQFQLVPPISGWSYSEVYAHIWDASLLTLEMMEDCLNGKGKHNKPTVFVTRLILLFGAFPPGRYKTPPILDGRVKLISKPEAIALIDTFISRLDVDVESMNRAQDDIKTLHPKLGYLNAREWLRFMEIHLKHHYQQLKRIEKSFA